MSYEKQIFSKGQVLKADDLNKMSEGIVNKLEFVDVEALPTENVDENSVYRTITYDFELYSTVKQYNDEVIPVLQPRFYFEIVDELPETGVAYETRLIEDEVFYTYYDKSNDDLYVYSETEGWVNAITLIDGNMGGDVFNPTIITDKAQATEELIYVLQNTIYQYFVYKNGIWQELVTKESIEAILPVQQRLYEHTITVGPGSLVSSQLTSCKDFRFYMTFYRGTMFDYELMYQMGSLSQLWGYDDEGNRKDVIYSVSGYVITNDNTTVSIDTLRFTSDNKTYLSGYDITLPAYGISGVINTIF